MSPHPWIVLKFGGTSVATAANWGRIADRVRQLLPTRRVWVVASALSQVSNRLEATIAEALADEPLESFVWIRDAHETLAREIGISPDDYAPVGKLLEELRKLLEGIRLTREASPRLRARVMSFGELASTHLGIAAFHHHGLDGQRVDARDLLQTVPYATGRPEQLRYLEADVAPRKDAAGADAAANGSSLVLTQGFIASNARGETCLLGRGGSDTSAALFAALTEAAALEIWTDVHGLFTTDPRQIPAARLIKDIGYREAEELAAMGAKVLHPRCLGPARWADVPVRVKNTRDPDGPGTSIGHVEESDPAVTAVVRRSGVTLLTIQTLDMWGASGFLAQVFAHFEALGMSIDLVATSQSAVSLTLDFIPGGTGGESFGELLARLGSLGEVTVVDPCAVVSIVGRRIRTVLHELGPAMAVFREHHVHLVSESSEDLNLSFVVDEPDAPKLVAALHARLLPRQGGGERFGPTWELLSGGAAPEASASSQRWWRSRRDELLTLCADGDARYVYDLATVRARAKALRQRLTHVGTVFYAMKANSHPDVLRTIAGEGLGMECVSAAEVDRVRSVLGDEVPILFTPNFCPPAEYAYAASKGAEVTIDGPHLLPFVGDEFAVRLDPGEGLGHHEKVRTAGAHAKFGQPMDELDALFEATRAAGKKIIGLHSHVGSGILEAGAWARTAELFAALAERLPDLRWIDVGGGLGVVERPGQQPLNLDAVNTSLAQIAAGLGSIELRMEPGRYLVSECGVLLAPVTQVRAKGDVRFVGVATGMNSLIRPALYGTWHSIHNLTRIDETATGYAHVVGPICETGDVLGRDRLLPETQPGDVLLIENAGAYGRVMSSSYNLRAPAEEIVLG
ncbi:MAG: bifunctional aspartate kinase/diaminopimelate decarboxylase [Proteobacteria bacterium]|nr:bifunctional aspartate kinase/diaminopimelate decarboxylase [Pseudomonadota bacterium]